MSKREVRWELTTNNKRDGFWSGWDRQHLLDMIPSGRVNRALNVELRLYLDDDSTEYHARIEIPANGNGCEVFLYTDCGKLLESFDTVRQAIRVCWGALIVD